jgi:hypothetical protein
MAAAPMNARMFQTFIPYSGIPCATEQGIFKRVSGKVFRRTGNWHADMRPLQPTLQNVRKFEPKQQCGASISMKNR